MTTNNTAAIHITILGSGTCVPSLTRSACAVLMTVGASQLLFDIGPGTMRRLLEAGVHFGHCFRSPSWTISSRRERLILNQLLVNSRWFSCILAITHIEELKDMFNVRIEVEKTGEGSTITIA